MTSLRPSSARGQPRPFSPASSIATCISCQTVACSAADRVPASSSRPPRMSIGSRGLPRFELALRTILRRVCPRVAPISVRLGLDECGTSTFPGTGDRYGSLGVERLGVLAVYNHARNSIGGGTIRQIVHRGRFTVRRVFAVLVVLDHKHHRCGPHRSHIESLVERSNIASAITEERDRDPIFFTIFRRPSPHRPRPGCRPR